MGRLTAVKIKSLSESGLYGDGGTLYLNIAPRGSKSWIQRITINGKRRDIGLGGYPLVSLAEARDKAFQNRKLARSGGDPLAAKRRVNVPTFREAAERTFEANRPRWRSAKVEKTWMQQLERHAFKRLGDLPVDMIGRGDILDVLVPIWTAKPEAARKLRQRMRATLRWAQAHGYVEHNVAGEVIDGALPAQPAVKEHLRALPYREVATAMETVEASGASVAAKLCLRFTILTAARSGEARGASWAEIDLGAREWRIPGSRMKTGAGASRPVVRCCLGSARTGAPVARRLGAGLSLAGAAGASTLRHGLDQGSAGYGAGGPGDGARLPVELPGLVRRDRQATRDRRGGAGAYRRRNVEGSYFRSDLFDLRRRLMDDWAGYLSGKPATVVQLHG